MMITDPLLFRFLAGQASGPENRRIKHWLAKEPENRERLESLRHFQEIPEGSNSDPALFAEWEKFESRMTTPIPVQSKIIGMKLTYIISAAAVILVLITSGLVFYLRYDARVIRNNELITKSFFLTDGTQVYLGPDSRLIKVKNFGKNQREVRLIGQAFFDVQADPFHPFMVSAGEAKIEVTGTRFSITAPRKTDEVEVTVKSGQVLFYNSQIINKKAFKMGLGPGDMGIYSRTLNRMDKTRDPYYLSTP